MTVSVLLLVPLAIVAAACAFRTFARAADVPVIGAMFLFGLLLPQWAAFVLD